MKIAETDPQRLVLVATPRLWAAVLAAGGALLVWQGLAAAGGLEGWRQLVVLVFGALLVFLAWKVFPDTRTVFDRDEDMVVHAESRLTGTTVAARPLAELRGAAVRADWSDGVRMTRLVLVFDDGEMALEAGFASADRGELAADINRWLGRAP